MIGFTLYIITGVIGPLVGRIIQRYGASKVFMGGALITAAGFVLLSQVNTLSAFLLGWTIIGFGTAGTGMLPAAVVVTHWFTRRRGTAIGIMSAGLGLGGVVIGPLIGGYFIPAFGWRTALLIMAALNCVIVPLALFIKTQPSDVGLSSDGVTSAERTLADKVHPAPVRGMTLKEASTTLTFWLIIIVFLFSNLSNTGVFQSQFTHLQDIGFPLSVAVTALGSLSFASLVGRLGFGMLSDRIQPRYACLVGMILQLVAVIILLQIKPASPAALIWLYAIIMGLGTASFLPTMSLMVSENFGLANYGTIFGAMGVAMSIGVALGPLAGGYMFDTLGSYSRIFLIYAILYGISIPAVLAIRHPGKKSIAGKNKT